MATGDHAQARNLSLGEGDFVQDPISSMHAGLVFIPPELHELIDVAECALDEQLEQLQRLYAAANRAAARARIELEALEQRRDILPGILEQVRRQRAAAETRSSELLRAIDALEVRRVGDAADD